MTTAATPGTRRARDPVLAAHSRLARAEDDHGRTGRTLKRAKAAAQAACDHPFIVQTPLTHEDVGTHPWRGGYTRCLVCGLFGSTSNGREGFPPSLDAAWRLAKREGRLLVDAHTRNEVSFSVSAEVVRGWLLARRRGARTAFEELCAAQEAAGIRPNAY